MEKAARKPNYSRWRAISLGSVYLLIGIHIAHWKIAGQTLAPLELNEVLYTLHLGIMTAGFIFMGLAMLSTLVAGRFFCSWMCHILALQDMSEWMLAKLKIKAKHIRSRTLLWVPFIGMGYMFILPQIERIYKGLPAVVMKVQSDGEGWASFVTNDFWRNLPGAGITLFTFFICGFLIIYLLGSRSFCQYACPYGALFAVADRIAPGKIIKTADCSRCGICTSVCSSHIRVHKEIAHFGKVVDPNCLKDLDCVQACPNDAIRFGFTKPSLLNSLSRVNGEKKHYDYTKAEDLCLLSLFLIFLVTFFGLYDSIPFLLAVALAIISAAVILKLNRLYKDEYSRINQFVLKKSGRLTANGKAFTGLASVLLLFLGHSIFIRFNQLTGEWHYNKIAFTNQDTKGHQNPDIGEELNLACDHLRVTYDAGLYCSPSLLRQLAAIAIYRNNQDEAVDYLEDMVDKLPGDDEARLRLAKLYIGTNREKQALPHLREITSGFANSGNEKKLCSDALVTLGHLEEKDGLIREALSHYRQSLVQAPGNQDALLAAGVLLARSGQLEEAEAYLLKAAPGFPQSPLIENNLAFIYMKQHQYKLARQHLERLIDMQPGNGQAVYNLVMVKYAMGDRADAINEMKTFIERYPEHPHARMALHKMESSVKNTEKKM